MVAHRLVEVHGVQHRGVVAGQQLVGDDQDLGLLRRLLEGLADLLLASLAELQLGHLRPVNDVRGVAAVDDLRPLRRQVAIERHLVLGAGLTVDSNQERLVVQRVDVLLEVVGDELRHLLHAVVGAEEGTNADRTVEHAVELLDVGDVLTLGQIEELLVELLGRDCHVRRRHHVADGQRRAVFDRLLDGVLVEVARSRPGARRSGTNPSRSASCRPEYR